MAAKPPDEGIHKLLQREKTKQRNENAEWYLFPQTPSSNAEHHASLSAIHHLTKSMGT